MTRLLPTVLAIPTFGTYRLDTRPRGLETDSNGLHSDDKDDSPWLAKWVGWDGWHKSLKDR